MRGSRVKPTIFLLWLALVGLCTHKSTAADVIPPIPEAEETWQVIYLADQRIGYGRIFVQPIEANTLIRTEAETHLSIKRFGQTLNMSTGLLSEETPAGDLRRFEFSMSNPPASKSTTKGVIDGAKLRLSAEVDGKRNLSSVEWKPGIKSPTYQDRLLRVSPLAPGEVRELEAFFPEMGKPGTMRIAAGKKEMVSLLNEQSSELQQLTVTNSLIPGVATKVWINAKGDTVKTSTSMLGTEMVSYTVPKEEALKSLSVAELDLGISTLVKTRVIPNPYETRKVEYRITLPDGDPSKEIPSGSTQAVTRDSDHVASVTVTSLGIPDTAKVTLTDPEYLESTQYLQSNDPLVKQHADRAAGALTDPAAIARAMESYVQKNLTQKNFSTALASAGEVARDLQGDCTEHAVLLAAMLRAKGIPARVAVGLVYVSGPSAFGGHMWTEANLNGVWVPLDATLGRGGTSGTHIKLGDAAFADKDGAPLAAFTSLMNVIGKLKIEVLKID